MSVQSTHFDERFVTRPKIATASPTDVAEDIANHRKTYSKFTRFFVWAALGGGAIFGALLFFIYY